MDDQVKSLLLSMEDHMEKSLQHFESELAKIRAGKAHVSMLDAVMVDYYGTPTPINQIGNMSAMDARTLTIQPWEKNMINPIERAIMEANLGLNPSNDGILIRIPVPALTEERRKNLVKQAKGEGETAKIAIRNLRKDANEKLKKLQKEGVSEDEVKTSEKKVQDTTDSYITKVDQILKVKEDEIMTV